MYLYCVFFKKLECSKQVGVNCFTSEQFTPQQNKGTSVFSTANSANQENATLCQFFNTIHVKNIVHILLTSLAQMNSQVHNISSNKDLNEGSIISENAKNA